MEIEPFCKGPLSEDGPVSPLCSPVHKKRRVDKNLDWSNAQPKIQNRKEHDEKQIQKLLGDVPLLGGGRLNAIPPHMTATYNNPIMKFIVNRYIEHQKVAPRYLGITEHCYWMKTPAFNYDHNEVFMNKAASLAHYIAEHANVLTHQHRFIQPGTKLQFIFKDPSTEKMYFSNGISADGLMNDLAGGYFGDALGGSGSGSEGGVLQGVRVLVRNHTFRGGCDNRVHKINCGDYIIQTCKSKDNNCGIACLYQVSKEEGKKKQTFNKIRQQCDIPLHIKLSQDDLKQVANYLKVGFRLYHIEGSALKPVLDYKFHRKHIANILYNTMLEHYSLLILKNKREQCTLCGKVIRNIKRHKCNPKNIEFYRKQVLDEKNSIAMFKETQVEEPYNLEQVYVFDLETFPDEHGVHQIYACLVKNVGKENELEMLRWGENVEHLEDILNISSQGTSVEYWDENPGEDQGSFKYKSQSGKIKTVNYYPFKSVDEAFDEAKKILDTYLQMNEAEHSNYSVKEDPLNHRVIIYKNNDTIVDAFNYHYNREQTKEEVERRLQEKKNYNSYIFIAHNLARFDGMFLMNYLISKGISTNITINAGRIISLQWHNSKVWDTCLFMPQKLKNIAENFKCKVQKGDFDHKLIRCWDDVQLYKEEANGEMGWKQYLFQDVLSLSEIVLKYSQQVYNIFQADCFDFPTLSSLTYNLWGNTTVSNKYEIQVPQDEYYHFIKDGIYGGRVFPMVKSFKASQGLSEAEQRFLDELYQTLDAGTYEPNVNSVESLKSIYQKLFSSGDFLSNQDMNSLYPTAMSQYEYPIGLCEWSNNPLEDFQKGYMGYYLIEFKPPKNIIMAILPQRNKPYFTYEEDKTANQQWKQSGICWSLENNKGIFTNIDIQLAIEQNYQITFSNKALVWKEKAPIFKNYIERIYQIKKNQDQIIHTPEYNPVERMIAKDMMNSLYGKCIQKPVKDKHSIVASENEFYDFAAEYDIVDWQILNKSNYSEEKLFLKGTLPDVENNKPQHLGAFILAYSRAIMTKRFRQVTNNLSECNFSYTDTDSMHIFGSTYKRLVAQQPDMFGENLGQMKNDISKDGGDAIIIREICIAPKNYLYVYLTSKGNVKMVKKIKGIPYSCLDTIKLNNYENEIPVEVEYETWKRHIVDEDAFEIQILHNTRTFLKTPYDKLKYHEEMGQWRPIGWEEKSSEPSNSIVNYLHYSPQQTPYDFSRFEHKKFMEPGIDHVCWYFKQEPAIHLAYGTRMVKLHLGTKHVNYHFFSKLHLNDILQYLDYVKDKNTGALQEIIQGLSKLYCDVDFKINHSLDHQPSEEFILTEALECIIQAANYFDVELNKEDFKIISGCTVDKYSWHIVHPTEVFKQQQHQKEFWNMVNKVAQDQHKDLIVDEPSGLTAFDLSIYSNNRCFRSIYSKKPGGSIFQPVNLHNQRLSDDEIKISEYLVVPEPDDNIVYSKLSREQTNKKVKGYLKKGCSKLPSSSVPFDQVIINFLEENKNYLQGYNLTSGTFNKSYIRLNRNGSGYCYCCGRNHDHENAFIVRKSKMLICYRSNQKFNLK